MVQKIWKGSIIAWLFVCSSFVCSFGTLGFSRQEQTRLRPDQTSFCNVLDWTGLDLTGTMVDLPDTMVDLPDTMVDLPDTMVYLLDTMVNIPDTMVDLLDTMVDYPDTMVDRDVPASSRQSKNYESKPTLKILASSRL